jgi:hypothetical protein
MWHPMQALIREGQPRPISRAGGLVSRPHGPHGRRSPGGETGGIRALHIGDPR